MVSPKRPKKHQTLESFGVLGVLQLWVVKPNWIFLLKNDGSPEPLALHWGHGLDSIQATSQAVVPFSLQRVGTG
jgi:hypothetical protein